MLQDPAAAACLPPAEAAALDPAAEPSPVSVFADIDAIAVQPDQPAVLHVEIRIMPGYHIVAADPGVADLDLTPLRVGLARGQDVAIYADYPPGEPLHPDHPLLVHRDIISFPVAIEHAPGIGASAGAPVLAVSFQACREDACLQPAALALAIQITTPENSH
jgi:hypothetical protein